jgi:hypothetical protein
MSMSETLREIQQDLENLGALGDDATRDVALRIGTALAVPLALRLQQLLSGIAAELTSEFDSRVLEGGDRDPGRGRGRFEVRLREGEPTIVFVAGGDEGDDLVREHFRTGEKAARQETGYFTGDDASDREGTGGTGTGRLTLRLPEALKREVERAASDRDLSVNSYVVRCLQRNLGGRDRRGRLPGQYLSGYGRA